MICMCPVYKDKPYTVVSSQIHINNTSYMRFKKNIFG